MCRDMASTWPGCGSGGLEDSLYWCCSSGRLLGLLGRQRHGGEDSPEAILKRRYASGEVDREEYERKLTDLRK